MVQELSSFPSSQNTASGNTGKILSKTDAPSSALQVLAVVWLEMPASYQDQINAIIYLEFGMTTLEKMSYSCQLCMQAKHGIVMLEKLNSRSLN
jgi:hypothetical protein